MKKFALLYIIVFVAASSVLNYAQEDWPPKRGNGPGKKIEELEKIKLIDALNLDEETSAKFFARRNEHRQKLDQLDDQLDDRIKKLEETVNNSKDSDDPQIKKMLDEIHSLQLKMDEEKEKFITSLHDLLSYRQIGKLIIFEKKFHEEIRKLLFKGRRRGRQ